MGWAGGSVLQEENVLEMWQTAMNTADTTELYD